MSLLNVRPSESSGHQLLYDYRAGGVSDGDEDQSSDVAVLDWQFVVPDQITTASNRSGELIFDETERLVRHQSQSTIQLLSSLLALKDDWNGYGSPAPNSVAHQNARRVLEELHQRGRNPARIAPSADGGIEVYLSRGARYCSIECFNDGTIVGGASDRGGRIETWSSSAERAELDPRIQESLDFLDG